MAGERELTAAEDAAMVAMTRKIHKVVKGHEFELAASAITIALADLLRARVRAKGGCLACGVLTLCAALAEDLDVVLHHPDERVTH